MSHQSGITLSDDLSSTISSLRVSESIRAIKICIEDEKLVLKKETNSQGSWEDDYNTSVLSMLNEKDPCFILYRFDVRNPDGMFMWLLIAYVPDFAQVRAKMLYASTRSTLKREFGDSLVQDELFGTTPDDVNLDGFRKHKKSESAPAPLSNSEMEVMEIKALETGSSVGASTRHEIASGINFPIAEEGLAAMRKLKDRQLSYVQLSIDISKETINLAYADSTDIDDVAAKMPSTSPRYHFLAFPHDFEGQSLSSIIFLYTCPGYNVPIKERMLYSSCKNNVVQIAEEDCGLPLDKKLEMSDASELTREFIFEELHPTAVEEKKAFAKPSPKGRGPRRLVRAADL